MPMLTLSVSGGEVPALAIGETRELAAAMEATDWLVASRLPLVGQPPLPLFRLVLIHGAFLTMRQKRTKETAGRSIRRERATTRSIAPLLHMLMTPALIPPPVSSRCGACRCWCAAWATQLLSTRQNSAFLLSGRAVPSQREPTAVHS